jgi:hypothetical protein
MRDPMETLEEALKRFPRLYKFYVGLNFCKGELPDGTEKPGNRFYDLFYHTFYLRCACCAALRGLAVGFVAGILCHMLWRFVNA